jgi:hypothetical protein
MRAALAVVLVVGMGGAVAQDPAPAPRLAVVRYGVKADTDNFLQRTPKEALASVVRAIQDKKIDYLLAQLADPEFVDRKVAEAYGGKFEKMVQATTARFLDEPEILRNLARFARDGEWTGLEGTATAASVSLKDSKDQVFFRKIEDRWFLLDRRAPEKAPAKE